MNTESYEADRKTRINKRFQLPKRSDYANNYKEKSYDNAQRLSEDSTASKQTSSSNIVLRLSESENCSIEDPSTSLSNNLANYRQNNKMVESKSPEKSEVIIISDSSDDDIFCTRKPEISRCATDTLKNARTNVYISSSPDESEAREDFILKYNDTQTVTQSNGRRKTLSRFKQTLNSFKTKQRCSILYTSDDTASTASSSKSKSKSSPSRKSKDSARSSPSHISPTPRSVGSDNSIKSRKSVSKFVSKQIERVKDPTSCGIGTSPSFCSTKYQKIFPRKISSRGTQLTKLDALKILKAVKSKRVKYFSPSSSDKSRVSETTDSDGEIQKDVPKKSNIINETVSDVEKSIIQNTPEIANPHKTHVSKFLETPKNIQEPAYNDLSARKRKEIANWLLTNSPDSKNDSSLSHISESNRNSLSSGNSSLDRLEANYETPNNRDKFLRRNIDENREVNDSDPKTPTNVFSSDVLNGVTLGATNKRVNIRTPQSETPITTDHSRTISTVKKRQTKIDDYLRKTRTPSGQYINELTPTNRTITKPSTVSKELNSENVRIEDCIDILDKLYGDTWRAKADVILSEPRRKPVAKKDRGVQTERKVIPGVKNRLRVESDSEEDVDFGKFVQNIKPTLNSTRKVGSRGSKPTNSTRRTKAQESELKDSFINDGSSSGGSGRSSYYTALTNPLLNNISKKPEIAPSPGTLRVMAICDPETDEETGKEVQNQVSKNDKPNRRRLSFSDDDDSGTSEFDPEDIVPPKSLPKKSVVKTAQHFSKPSIKSIRNVEAKKAPSFLASLSASVPMTCSHPEARVYKENFKRTKEALCKKLYSLYNEKIFDKKLPDDMLIEWSTRMRGTAGFCYNKKSIKALGSVTRSSRIVLATKVVDNAERLRDTLVHEMCHAATWVINEISDGHGPLWKGWASKAMKAFPELPPISRCHDYKIKTKYTYKCTSCGYSIGRHSKSLDVQKKRCGYCYGKFEVFVNRTTKSGTVNKTPSRSKDPSAFALFVKENYSSVKQNRRSMKHGEVMKVLGQQFSAIKIAKKQDDIIEENEKSFSE